MRPRRLLLPASLVYGAAAALRRESYDRGWRARFRVGVPVVSVGGLSLGGSGKTPIAMLLADALLREGGLKVGVVHSGYGGRAGGQVRQVTLSGDEDGRWYGDEATLLARRLKEAVVVRGSDKVEAARRCVAAGAEVVLLDDGLQHLRLWRDFDIVCWARPPGLPIPAGDEREFGYVAKRADLLWWHDRSGELLAGSPIRTRGCVDASVVSTVDPQALTSPCGRRVAEVSELSGARVHLLAGIADPAAFRALVERCGAHVTGETFIRDHRFFSARALARVAGDRRAELVLCSEKDAARCPAVLRRVGALALRCGTRVVRGSDLIERLVAAVLEGKGLADEVAGHRSHDRSAAR